MNVTDFAQLKLQSLYLGKRLGLFEKARHQTRRALRILCYHNFVEDDDPLGILRWNPYLSISATTLERRLSFLQEQGYHLLDLNEAVRRLSDGSLPNGSVVFTIDDGWYSTKTIAHPILARYRVPYTVYLSSYYSRHQVPVFNVYVRYALESTGCLELSGASIGAPDLGTFDLHAPQGRARAIEELLRFAETHLDRSGRHELAARLGSVLAIGYADIDRTRALHFLTAEETASLVAEGVDFQLHAHRHRWPRDRASALRELEENRRYLEPLVNRSLTHFCYPSGIWSPEQFGFLREAGIVSSTTCDSGFNDRATEPLALKRFLDSEDISQLIFEAELSGFLELARVLRARLHDAKRRIGDLRR